MKRSHSFFHQILTFVLAQVAWLTLLGIWIYWYVSNYLIFRNADTSLSEQSVAEGRNVAVLVCGLVLLAVVSFLMSLQFHRLNVQSNLARLYDNFISSVTHELKSPLASIQLALETLHFHDIPRAKQQEFLRMMLRDTARLNQLINAILEIPAIEQKKIAHNYQIHPVGPLINALIKESVEQFNLPSETVRIEGGGGCLCVVDRNALKIVLDNLIDNSMKYSAESPEILISMHCGSKYFSLDYRDRGVGISSKNQKKVFEKFFRIHDRNSPNVKGTGLGLYICREIIRYHGGKISVSSKGRNRGSLFHIELPVYNALKNRYLQNLLKIAQKRRREQEAADA